jgi:hypothetical protein
MASDYNNLWINKELLQSRALRTITSPTVFLVLMDFYGRKQVTKKKGNSGNKKYDMTNNGELFYTYAEAEKKGISRTAFMKAIDELLARGFIFIAKESGGLFRVATQFGLSDEWKRFGQTDFKPGKRTQRKRHHPNAGFKAGHDYFPPRRRKPTKQPGDL